MPVFTWDFAAPAKVWPSRTEHGAVMDADADIVRPHAAGTPAAQSVDALLAAARRGCPTSLGWIFEALRARLVAVADQELPVSLRAKMGPSDLVQETAIDMQRDFASFRGSTAEECFAWLRSILRNNVVDKVRQFEATQKRDLGREEPIDPAGRDAGGRLPACTKLPEGSAIRHEDAAAVSQALARLPADHRTVIELRYWRGLSFGDIGVEMGRSPDAVRKLWYRAIERLQAELAAGANPGGAPPVRGS